MWLSTCTESGEPEPLLLSLRNESELLTKSIFRKIMLRKRRNYVDNFIKIWVCQQLRIVTWAKEYRVLREPYFKKN